MLAYIMGLLQSYENSHGYRPQFVYLNQKHMSRLLEECPWLNDMEDRPALGFRIVVISDKELRQPRAVWIPPLPNYRIRRNAEMDIPECEGPCCAAVRHY